jgi:hypothetical protein
MDGQWLLDAGIITFKTRFSLTVSAVNSTTSKRTMVFGFGKSSPRPWTMGSYPGYPGPTMLVTNVPTYSVASPCYSYAPQLASPMIVQPPVQTIPVPVPVAVQYPLVQIPPPTTTYTVFQPASSIPSPVIPAPVAMAPANLLPVRAPPSPRPQHPQSIVDAGNALMLVQTPQQAQQSSPSVLNISLHLSTPQQQPMQFNGVAQYQSVPSPFSTVLED